MFKTTTTPAIIRRAMFLVCCLGLLGLSLAGNVQPSGSATTQRAGTGTPADSVTTVIDRVRVFDGETLHAETRVVFDSNGIQSVGPAGDLPADAVVIDGSGKTLLPGLIDGHTHTFQQALEQALDFGVTTHLDMFADAAFAEARRAEQRAGNVVDRADLFSASTLVTAPGGHGTQFGLPIDTLSDASGAQAFVAARVAEGADFIKIVIEDGTVVGRPIPTLDETAVRAVVDAAHQHGLLAVVHVSTLEGAWIALRSGADGLVHMHHSTSGLAENREFARAAAERDGFFLMPTMSILETVAGAPGGPTLIEDPRLAPYLDRETRGNLSASFGGTDSSGSSGSSGSPEAAGRVARFLERLSLFVEAGVPILAGTDAPNPGTGYGVSLHRELELLVRAGLTPSAALRAATADAADAFRLDDRGRIAPGKRADLVLVEGDPTRDITASRAIFAIWKGGVRHERIAAEVGAATLGRQPATVTSFDESSLETTYGSWMTSTDQMAGGDSTVELDYVTPGAQDSTAALRVRGELGRRYAFPWAGAMYSPGEQAMQEVDLSAADRIRFFGRGSGRLRVMVFAASLGRIPAQKDLDLSSEWTLFEVPLSDFRTDGSDLMAVLFSGAGRGPFEFEIDEIAFD